MLQTCARIFEGFPIDLVCPNTHHLALEFCVYNTEHW